MIDSKSTRELTIASVCYSIENRMLLELNFDFTSARNQEKNWVWIVADNTLPESGVGKIDDTKFVVVSGGRVPANIPTKFRGSYHHALALNAILPHVRTRFFMVLDNDFFVVQPEWIKTVINHMKESNLAFFGSSFNPGRYGKYRYFPSVNQFCVFDLSKIDIKELDFLPQYTQITGQKETTNQVELQSTKIDQIIMKMTRTSVRFLIKIFFGKKRLKISTSRDTGYQIYQRFKKSNLKSECVQAVFKPTHLGINMSTFSLGNRLFEKILPERLSFIPKKRDYYTKKCFAERGYPDAQAYNWEEYVWRGLPFSIHLRRNRWEKPEEKIREVRDYLYNFSKNSTF